ncbi:hypothetical protein BMS3Abin12_01781 [bacterium BMS3Abin12]|nr:hypothetical protein BMS3Abin12_01781 [bacterium BMS3Abin12]
MSSLTPWFFRSARGGWIRADPAGQRYPPVGRAEARRRRWTNPPTSAQVNVVGRASPALPGFPRHDGIPVGPGSPGRRIGSSRNGRGGRRNIAGRAKPGPTGGTQRPSFPALNGGACRAPDHLTQGGGHRLPIPAHLKTTGLIYASRFTGIFTIESHPHQTTLRKKKPDQGWHPLFPVMPILSVAKNRSGAMPCWLFYFLRFQ